MALRCLNVKAFQRRLGSLLGCWMVQRVVPLDVARSNASDPVAHEGHELPIARSVAIFPRLRHRDVIRLPPENFGNVTFHHLAHLGTDGVMERLQRSAGKLLELLAQTTGGRIGIRRNDFDVAIVVQDNDRRLGTKSFQFTGRLRSDAGSLLEFIDGFFQIGSSDHHIVEDVVGKLDRLLFVAGIAGFVVSGPSLHHVVHSGLRRVLGIDRPLRHGRQR
mmetsp:Transcript_20780/g.59243  ORF Transcript_20780/g.59243 Transcript_20780/m.59243 type:complete len:219 (-) Transcript_20780:726-1382(-)